MKSQSVRPATVTLPVLRCRLNKLTVDRAQIQAFDLNPFSFYVNYDSAKMLAVDAKVQEFGKQFTEDDHVGEPQRWALVFVADHWHRAEVLEKYYNANEECSGAEVSLIDTGCKTVIDITRIFPMRTEVLAAAPAQSLRIFPKNIDSSSTRQLNILFDTYPDMKLRITFDDELNMSSRQKPHLVGSFAEIHVGYKEWIHLGELLHRFTEDPAEIDDACARQGSSESQSEGDKEGENSRPTSETLGAAAKRNSAASLQQNCKSISTQDVHSTQASDATVRKLDAGPPRIRCEIRGSRPRSISCDVVPPTSRRADSSEEEELAVEVEDEEGGKSTVTNRPTTPLTDKAASDDDAVVGRSGTQTPDDTNAYINYAPPSTKSFTEIEGKNQEMILTERSIENARKAAKKNEKRNKICISYHETGDCHRGEVCPFSHEVPLEKVLTGNGETIEFQDFSEIDLSDVSVGFGLCSHVDEDGTIYLVLPYGPVTIWNALEVEPTELELLDITQALCAIYDSRRGRVRDPIGINEHLAVAWLDKLQNGPLRNVSQGWYRVKILQRDEKSCEVYLVDHGAQLRVKLENLYPLERKLRSFPQQAIRCCLQDTKLIGSAESLYNDLKMQMLIFKLYEGKLTDGQHVVELFSEYGKTHCGDQLVVKGILADSN